MGNKASTFLVVLVVGLAMPLMPTLGIDGGRYEGHAQQPQSQVQNPCAAEVAAADLQTRTKNELLDEANKKNAALIEQLNEAGKRLTIEQGNSASLVVKNTEKDRVIVGRDKAIAEQAATLVIVTAQRDEGRRRIEKANRRRLCRKFHWLCVK
jgi:hypothetical protein